MREVLAELRPSFERASGHTLAPTFDTVGFVMKRIEGGETFDLVIVPRAGAERLAQAGKGPTGAVSDLASVVAGVAVRKGAAKPDISSAEAFKHALLAAGSIARPDPAAGGPSGAHIESVLQGLGIAAEVKAKSVMARRSGDPSATPGHALAAGDADIALHDLQELMAVPGIDIVGAFPPELRQISAFSAVIPTGAKEPEAARALIDFLRTPDAKAVIKAKGLAPASP
jgi:molybdate transport system substrate-binding protein